MAGARRCGCDGTGPEGGRDSRRPEDPRRLRLAADGAHDGGGVRRPHQAADHRAAAGDHRPDDVPGRRRGARRWGSCWPPCSAARWPPAAPTRSTRSCDRDIDAVMRRTGRRPLATGAITPAGRAGLRRRRWASPSLLWMAWTVNALAAWLTAGRDRLLRARLHDGAQAAHPAEHRLGRRGRLHARADRLGRRHRRSLAWTPVVLFAVDLLLDPAALLAAVAAVPGRLRRRPACRCCRWSRRRPRWPGRSSGYSWAMVAATRSSWCRWRG